MKGFAILEEFEDHWVTDMGKWFPGERVVLRGKDLLNELRDMRWMAQLLFAITGRCFSDEEVQLFEGIWSITVNYPDPRIWPNRVAALAGTARSTAGLGVSAAMAVSEAELFGHRANIRTIDFMIRTRKRIDNGESIEDIVRKELKTHRWVPGFGRPFVQADERIKPLLELAQSLGFGDGPHVKLAFAVSEVLSKSRYPMRMNIAALGATLAADRGLSPMEYHRCFILSFLGGMVPSFIDTDSKAEGAFFPLNCRKIKYEGPDRRYW